MRRAVRIKTAFSRGEELSRTPHRAVKLRRYDLWLRSLTSKLSGTYIPGVSFLPVWVRRQRLPVLLSPRRMVRGIALYRESPLIDIVLVGDEDPTDRFDFPQHILPS